MALSTIGVRTGPGTVEGTFVEITYRTFRNTDPPRFFDLWNRSVQTRGFGRLASKDNLEQMLFSKATFDPLGLFMAFHGSELVGICHAGFGANDDRSAMDRTMGVVSMLLVDPEYRNQGIGTELLRHAQKYLHDRSATIQYIGGVAPINPFYLGLYGGSELPGVLDSDEAGVQFCLKRNYVAADTVYVFQRELEEIPTPDDKRVPLLWRQVEMLVEPWPNPANWWQACVLGPMISLSYEMVDRNTKKTIGKAWVWEMESFGRAWSRPVVGISSLEIREEFRRQGYGKLFLHGILKHLRGQKIELVEVQTMERNEPARNLYQMLGFQHIDTGHAYRYQPPLA